MKKWLIIIFVILTLLTTIGVLGYKLQRSNENYSIAMINYKASEDQYSSQKRVFELTLAQVYYSQDSLLQETIKLAEDNNIKDKRINSLQYIIDSYHVADTIYLKDSIFVDVTPSFKEELTFGDQWHTLELLLEYPNKVGYDINFKSHKDIIVYDSKETIKPPKKFFLWRWFQKKHLILEVLVEENNPYVDEDSRKQKYVKIIN